MTDQDIVEGMRHLLDRGILTGSVGNASTRSGSTIRITPTRTPYAEMSADDLVTVDLEGSVLEPDRVPSIEAPLHLAIYRARADVAAIIHSHPPHCVAWSFLGADLEPMTEDSAYYGIGEVRTTPWAPPGSIELAETLRDTLADSAAVLIARHGLITVADTVGLGVTRTEIVEHRAQIAWLLRTGGQ